jgi:alginate O-acetyltransferase complex protein AlgI
LPGNWGFFRPNPGDRLAAAGRCRLGAGAPGVAGCARRCYKPEIMLFNSFAFAVFFPAAVGAYFLTPVRLRWLTLLVASYTFYMFWRADYAALLVLSTLTDYAAALAMERTENRRWKRLWLGLSLSVNLGLLAVFKYLGFLSDTVHAVTGGAFSLPELDVLLPLGISFYTFQTLSYSIDVYRGDRPAERHLGRFALYVSFFPQLVAGPIERSTRLLPQFRATHRFNRADVTAGLRLMLWGFFKKLVIADRLGMVVDMVYAQPDAHSPWAAVLVMYCFTFQIYADFSGYSDIAIGAARVMGFDLMENFRRPFYASSVSEHWRRWHISLSTWFRDYVFVPLGGSRVNSGRVLFNLMVVFLVSGLWHGAAWTFVIWGGLHGIAVCLERVLGVASLERRSRAVRFVGWLLMFHFLCAAFIIFRSPSLADAVHMMARIFEVFQGAPLSLPVNTPQLGAMVLGVAVLMGVEWFQGDRSFGGFIAGLPGWLRWTFYYSVFAMIVVLGVFRAQEFIYFQF